ncbi:MULTISPECIES: ABC transporter substrate-binding protein [Pseudomonas]|uniref:ABC transporter substrate-binding protein n=1 Tax=Pseudomonas nitroreducens TaxID=46680 RepID=UPI001E3B8C60|nr:MULTISPECIES: ABC transporter substrate-binding protein [Pseudomonas]MCE4069542.1 ABC transporter substrate-binding protein [Pseudomonas nitritireducens]MCE4079295.1 ABC transporter substrate-binding protein [Pseudomonas nitroreducens]
MKASILGTLLLTTATSAALANEITVVSFGGVAKQVQTEAFYKPYEKETGNTVVATEYNGEMGRIKAMVDTQSVNWDVVEVGGAELITGCEEGLFETLDQSNIGEATDFVPGAISQCGAGVLVWSTAMAYNADRFKVEPTGWADFWDLKRFPGKRSLHKSAKYTLEIALMADGVPSAEVYKTLSSKEGVDRAFRKLDEIKSSIQWWEAGAQPMQYLASGDVAMTSAFNGRVFSAQESGANIKIIWQDSIYDIDSWAIPKGSKNKLAAEKFINLSLRPEHQKLHTEKLGYGSTNVHTQALLEQSLAERINTAPNNLSQALRIDNTFWVDHGEELEERFNAWAARGLN